MRFGLFAYHNKAKTITLSADKNGNGSITILEYWTRA